MSDHLKPPASPKLPDDTLKGLEQIGPGLKDLAKAVAGFPDRAAGIVRPAEFGLGLFAGFVLAAVLFLFFKDKRGSSCVM